MAKKKHYEQSSHGDFQRFQGKCIIPVMGATGAGKSTFINRLLGNEVAKVGYSLGSCTTDLQAIDVPSDIVEEHLPQWCATHPENREVVIVDTPGFDDTNADDCEILKRIADWLAKTYGSKANLAGIIYLHEIVADRWTGSRKRNFDVFKKLCGKDSCRSVVLGTTKWGKVQPNELENMKTRQNELRDVFWKEMTAQGSTVQRVDETAHSAWSLVGTVLNRDRTRRLQIQAELVELSMSLPETDAANVLREEVRKQIEQLKRSGADKEEIRAFVSEIDKLRPGILVRFRKWFSFL